MNSISQSLASTASGPALLVFGSAMEYRIEFSSQRPSQNRWLLRGSLKSTVIHVHCHIDGGRGQVRTALGQNNEISGLVIIHTILLAARREHDLGEWLKR